MRTDTIYPPTGTDPAATFFNEQNQRLNQELQAYSSGAIKAQCRTRGQLSKLVIPIYDFSYWAAAGRNYSQYATYSEGEHVWIAANNPIVTAGAIDLYSGTNVKCTQPGLWVCIQDNGPGFFGAPPVAGCHVPQSPWPYPDDPSNVLNYWIPVGSAGTTGGTIQMYLIDTSYDPTNKYDYIPCKATNDGTTTYGSIVKVAKNKEQRPSVTSEVVDTVTFTYTYTDDNNRSSTDGTTTQNEVCYYRYLVGKQLFAAQAQGGNTGVTGASWYDLTTRAWLRKYSG